jgi:hypothetical protein
MGLVVSNETVPADGQLVIVDMVFRRMTDIGDEIAETLHSFDGHLDSRIRVFGLGICRN